MASQSSQMRRSRRPGISEPKAVGIALDRAPSFAARAPESREPPGYWFGVAWRDGNDRRIDVTIAARLAATAERHFSDQTDRLEVADILRGVRAVEDVRKAGGAH